MGKVHIPSVRDPKTLGHLIYNYEDTSLGNLGDFQDDNHYPDPQSDNDNKYFAISYGRSCMVGIDG